MSRTSRSTPPADTCLVQNEQLLGAALLLGGGLAATALFCSSGHPRLLSLSHAVAILRVDGRRVCLNQLATEGHIALRCSISQGRRDHRTALNFVCLPH